MVGDIDAFESIAQVLKLPKESGYMLRRMWMISEMMTIITEAWDIKAVIKEAAATRIQRALLEKDLKLTLFDSIRNGCPYL